MPLDRATVAKIAHLARIRMDDADLDAMTGELSNILGFVEQLAEVDTAGVEPMTSVAAQTLRKRADAVTDGGYPDRVLANAPSRKGRFFTVPKVVE
jgi:aspartyl-tRNA(Asn)/glutamyl-tRNA(Gln) amidotransferase subunit C